jgi:hypothetical protein
MDRYRTGGEDQERAIQIWQTGRLCGDDAGDLASLPDHAAMYAVSPGQSLDRFSGGVLAPDRFE